jgi:hypothetical protein
MSKLPFPVQIVECAIDDKTGVRKITNDDWLAGDVDPNVTFRTVSFKDFLAEANLDHIDFLKVDCEGGEYDVFTEENYEFLTQKVGYITGEWHLSYMKDGLNRFRHFRDLYLKGKNNFRVFEPYEWKEVTHKILDDTYLLDFFNWWDPRNKGAQFMIYIDNTK